MIRLLIGLFLASVALMACNADGTVNADAAVATAQVLLKTEKPIKASGGDFTVQEGSTCNVWTGFSGTLIFKNSLPSGIIALNYLGSDGKVAQYGYRVRAGLPDFGGRQNEPEYAYQYTSSLQYVAAGEKRRVAVSGHAENKSVTACQLEVWDTVSNSQPSKLASATLPITYYSSGRFDCAVGKTLVDCLTYESKADAEAKVKQK